MAFRYVLSAGAVAAALVSLPAVGQVPPSLEQKAQNLQSDLTAKGYEVAPGQWHLFTIHRTETLPLSVVILPRNSVLAMSRPEN